jgi:hypothetical protein
VVKIRSSASLTQKPLRRAALQTITRLSGQRLAVSVAPVIPAVVAAMICVTPVNRRPPVATSPSPMVIAPSPASTHPDVSRGGTSRHELNHRCWHRRWHDDWGWGHDHWSRGCYNWGWNRDSEAETDINPSVCSRDYQSRQGQDCDSLFHIVYRLDASGRHSLLTNRLRFCNPTKSVSKLLSVRTTAPSLNWTYPGSTRRGIPFDEPGSQSKDGGVDEGKPQAADWFTEALNRNRSPKGT